MGEWQIRSGAIVERPRTVDEYPLLSAVYDRHDSLIERHVDGGRMLEVAFGTHPHPDADVAVEAYPENAREVGGTHVAAADARELPFEDDAF
ncbi:MAG TPA: class I SAM-dependent methyltransferase, partial [Halobacteriales archaeon]|nr:class I SAM-dependent methyltransferase [Halobacteriales archaeon]